MSLPNMTKSKTGTSSAQPSMPTSASTSSSMSNTHLGGASSGPMSRSMSEMSMGSNMSGSSVPGMQQGMAGGLQGGMNVPGGPQVAQSEIGTFNHLLATNPDVIHPPEHVVRQGQYFSALAAQQGVGPNGLPMNMMNAQMAGGMNPAVQQQLLRQQVARQQAAARAGQPGAPAGANPSGNHSVWQSEADIPLRRRMIAKIVPLLQNRKPNAPKEWIVKLPDMARRLEDSMYRTASCE